jgi:hypothetical protein
MTEFLNYEVPPGDNVPGGLPRLKLPVLSPIWRGETLLLEFPNRDRHRIIGWRAAGRGTPCEVRVFWTRHQPQGPAVCLAIGGNGGLRDLGPEGASQAPRGLPFLALAEGLIPAAVREVIGEAPPPEPPPPLLLR